MTGPDIPDTLNPEAVAVIAAHFHAATCRCAELKVDCDGATTADFELARFALTAAIPHLDREANRLAIELGAAAERLRIRNEGQGPDRAGRCGMTGPDIPATAVDAGALAIDEFRAHAGPAHSSTDLAHVALIAALPHLWANGAWANGACDSCYQAGRAEERDRWAGALRHLGMPSLIEDVIDVLDDGE